MPLDEGWRLEYETLQFVETAVGESPPEKETESHVRIPGVRVELENWRLDRKSIAWQFFGGGAFFATVTHVIPDGA